MWDKVVNAENADLREIVVFSHHNQQLQLSNPIVTVFATDSWNSIEINRPVRADVIV
jgi:hypothetical protein